MEIIDLIGTFEEKLNPTLKEEFTKVLKSQGTDAELNAFKEQLDSEELKEDFDSLVLSIKASIKQEQDLKNDALDNEPLSTQESQDLPNETSQEEFYQNTQEQKANDESLANENANHQSPANENLSDENAQAQGIEQAFIFEEDQKPPSKRKSRAKEQTLSQAPFKRHFIDIVSFEYLGTQSYDYTDAKGKKYLFKQGDLIFLKNDETARYFAYKDALFKKLV